MMESAGRAPSRRQKILQRLCGSQERLTEIPEEKLSTTASARQLTPSNFPRRSDSSQDTHAEWLNSSGSHRSLSEAKYVIWPAVPGRSTAAGSCPSQGEHTVLTSWPAAKPTGPSTQRQIPRRTCSPGPGSAKRRCPGPSRLRPRHPGHPQPGHRKVQHQRPQH